jgi:hypothetical protein
VRGVEAGVVAYARIRRRVWRQEFEIGWAVQGAVGCAEFVAEGAVAAGPGDGPVGVGFDVGGVFDRTMLR